MITAIVNDIEGTTSSISFVKDVLFPYARERLAAFVDKHRNDPEVRRCLAETACEAAIPGASDDVLVGVLIAWIDADRKATPLKALQGMIWEAGYAAGDFVAHVYVDAARRLREWHAAGVRLYVYSSGSIAAQKLFFKHSERGDLSGLFSAYFDTTTGAKRDPISYEKILSAIGSLPESTLFLSDIVEELDAARQAGLQTRLLVRDAGAPPDGNTHTWVSTYHDISV